MTERLHLRPRHRERLEALLREHLPGVEVWAYGSRVNGQSHDGSDLDLVLRGRGLDEIELKRGYDLPKQRRQAGAFPTSTWRAREHRDFFRTDRDGVEKGVVLVDLRSLP